MVLIGKGDKKYEEKLNKIINEKKLQNVIFTGFLTGEEKERFMQTLSLVVLPSHSENFGMVVGEALQYEIPVIASKGTPWEDLQTYRCGWWVDNDIDTLSQTIEQAMMLSDIERINMGKRGRQLIINKYESGKVAEQMLQL